MTKIEKILFPSELREYALKYSAICTINVWEIQQYDLSAPCDRGHFQMGGFYIPHISLDMYQKEAMEAAEKFMDKVC